MGATANVAAMSAPPAFAARRFWSLYEPVHAICYYHPTFAETLVGAGLTGSWNGYFAGRAAPLGASASSAVVAALFFGFSPAMVARAIPKIWHRIEPAAAVQARLHAAQVVLQDAATAGSFDDLRRVTDLLERSADSLCCDGRALAAAWAAESRPTSTLARLWLAATVLREHRGDGHVAVATAMGLTGLELALTHIGTGAVPRQVLAAHRGWTDGQWAEATERLTGLGIIDDRGRLTARGRALRQEIEAATDRIAAGGHDLLDDTPSRHVLTSLTRALFDRGAIVVPNPIGVTRC